MLNIVYLIYWRYIFLVLIGQFTPLFVAMWTCFKWCGFSARCHYLFGHYQSAALSGRAFNAPTKFALSLSSRVRQRRSSPSPWFSFARRCVCWSPISQPARPHSPGVVRSCKGGGAALTPGPSRPCRLLPRPRPSLLGNSGNCSEWLENEGILHTGAHSEGVGRLLQRSVNNEIPLLLPLLWACLSSGCCQILRSVSDWR